MKLLIAGPFVGELGWECFSWQPLVHGRFETGNYDRCIVYTKPGRSLLYPFAEVREYQPLAGLVSVCNGTMWEPDSVELHQYCIGDIDTEVRTEFPDDEVTRLHGLMVGRCEPHYDEGKHEILQPEKQELVIWPSYKRVLNSKGVCLCIRDRGLSPFRNWPYKNWISLADWLAERCRVVVIGQTREPIQFGSTVLDWTNNTTIDKCISLFQRAKPVCCDLAVGGSSGLLHLASRCGLDHLVWGDLQVARRFRETNWCGAKHKTFLWGWQPTVGSVKRALEHWLNEGELV